MWSNDYTTVGTTNASSTAGYAFDNIPIFNGLAGNDVDAVIAEYDTMDLCGTHSSPNMELHYHSIGYCMKSGTHTSTSTAPALCATEADCNAEENVVTWNLSTWTDKTNYGGYVGLARDGHVILGPYNQSGETWSCDEHDVCNGVWLDDGSYAYVATTTFPYIVGCWGPGATTYTGVAPSCSTNSCSTSDRAMDGLTILVGTFAALAASLAL